MIDKTDPTNRDTVPAMLTPGEFVLNKEASTMFAPVIEQMNDAGLQHRAMKNMGGGIQNYNDGGFAWHKNYTPEVEAAIVSAAAKYGIDPLTLKTIVYLESRGNPEAQSKQSSAGGIMQFIDDTAKSYNLENRFDVNESLDAGSKLLTNNVSHLKSVLGREPTPAEIYLAHQQGATGALRLLKDPSINVLDVENMTKSKVVKNGGNVDMTAGEFANMWMQKANDAANFIGGGDTSTQTAAVPETQQPTTQTVSSESVPRFFSGGGADGVGNFGTLGDFFGGVTTPPVETMSSIPPKTMPNTQADPIAVEQAIMQSSVPQVQAAPPVPTNFNEAFRDARADMGAGGIFTFRGNDYTTDYAEEKDMVTANMGGVVYLNDGSSESSLMPDVNSDESLLQGSSGSVDRASRMSTQEIMSMYPVPKVQGVPTEPFPAPRPTMLDGQLYYLNGDGFVTDSNGAPVQNPEIGAAVQDKLNYSAKESAANAEAFNESMAQQDALNGTNLQSVNPSYDSMRQRQESDAAEAEKIRAEIAQIDMERQAANDEFNNRGPVVVPPLERGPPLFVEGFVPPIANSGKGGGGPAYVPPKPSNATFEGKSLEELYNMFAVNGGQGSRADPVLGQALMAEIEARESSGESFNVYDTSLHNAAALYGGGNRPEVERQQYVADTSSRNAEKSASILAVQQAELQAKLDAGTATQLDVDRFERKRKQNETVQGIATRDQETVRLTSEQQAALLAPATDIEAANAEALKAQRKANSERLQSYDPVTGTYSKPKKPQNNIPEVEAAITNLEKTPEGLPPTTVSESVAAKQAADSMRVDPKDPEVSGAMSMLKSVFGDLFDTKELMRAAVMYLGGRATGLSGNQALAFAGKNYIARTDAKTGTYQKVALEGKHTKDSLAVYKKTMNPADLVAKGQPAIETGDYKDVYHTKSGSPVKLIEKETSTGRKLYFYEGKQVNLNDFTTDGRYSVGSKDHAAYKLQLNKSVVDQVKELNDMNMADVTDGKTARPILDIAPTTIGRQAANYVIKNQLPLEVMQSLVDVAYQDALAEKRSTGKTPNSMEPFFERAYVKSKTSNVVNFTLGNGKPAPAASVNQFFGTIRDMATAAEQVENPDFKLSSLNDTQLSTWLLQSKTYTSWNQITDPEEKKDFVDRGAKEVPPRSGFMQYVLEGYPKTS